MYISDENLYIKGFYFLKSGIKIANKLLIFMVLIFCSSNEYNQKLKKK